jgi:RNA polymerase sigma factor (sigma-70 family)
VSDESREHKLLRRALAAGILETRAAYWHKRYGGCAEADELVSRANAALPRIVEKYQDALGAFEDYCRRRVDFVMLTGIRVEARHLRIDRAAQRAAADLLALQRSTPGALADALDATDAPGVTPREQARALARAVAAATFVAMAQEAQRAGQEDMISRQDFATAMTVISATLAALPRQQQKVFALVYGEGRSLTEAHELLGYHYNTVLGWHAKVLAAIRKQLEKHDIKHAPGRGGAPRVALRVLRGGSGSDEGEGGDDEEEGDEGGEGEGEG